MDTPIKLVSGVTLTPPAIGRIMMGHTEIRAGKGPDAKTRALPARDDHFTITTLRQNADRSWVRHPLADKLAKDANGKLTAIPVRVAYNDPNLSIHNRYTCFDPEKGRVLCAGNGVKARRATESGVQSIDCPRVEACEYGQRMRCKNMTRIYLQIDGQSDELGVFVLRTTSFNSLDRVAGKLTRLYGLTGGKLAGMPLMLTIHDKTSAMSMRTPFWFADLEQRAGMSLIDTAKAASAWQRHFEDAGLSLEGLEQAARAGLANGDFADELEDIEEWLSDEDLVREAERNLQRSGLRGLDAVVKEAKGETGAPPAQSAGIETPVAPDRSDGATADAAGQPPAPRTLAPLPLGAPPARKGGLPMLPKAA